MSTLRHVPRTIKLVKNINEAFRAIVAIARKLKIDLNREVTSVINGLLTIGGMLVGGYTAGPRGVVSGGLAGASLANRVTSNDNLISLADYLLRFLPSHLKQNLVDFFAKMLSPFRNVDEAVTRITSSASMVGKFKNIMEMFLNQHDNSYHVSS